VDKLWIEGVMMPRQKGFAIAMRARMARSLCIKKVLRQSIVRASPKIPISARTICCGMHWDSHAPLTLSANTQSGEEEQKLEGPALYIRLPPRSRLELVCFFLLPAGVGGLAEHTWMEFIGE